MAGKTSFYQANKPKEDPKRVIRDYECHMETPAGLKEILSDPRHLVNLARAYAKVKDDANAIKYFLLAADLLTKTEFYSRAIACCKELLDIDKNNRNAFRRLSLLFTKVNMYEEAKVWKAKLRKTRVPRPLKRRRGLRVG